MEITLQRYELANMLRDASEIAVKRYRIERGEEKPYVSQSEAYRLFGEGIVKRWVKEGLIKRRKDGNNTSTVRYDRLELEILAKSNNRLTYLDSKERKENKNNSMEKYIVKITTSNNTPSYYQKGNGDPSRTISLYFAEIFAHEKLAEITKARLSKIYPQREFTVVPIEVTIIEKK